MFRKIIIRHPNPDADATHVGEGLWGGKKNPKQKKHNSLILQARCKLNQWGNV